MDSHARLIADGCVFFDFLRVCLLPSADSPIDRQKVQTLLEQSRLPRTFWGFAITIYQPGRQRLMVVRADRAQCADCIHHVISRAREHERFSEFDIADHDACHVQFDFIYQPDKVDFSALSDQILGPHRFEMGVDGLRIIAADRRRYFLPGDAFVFSILGMKQLASHMRQLFPGKDFSTLEFQKFRSDSFVSTAEGWQSLYRGLPQVEAVTPRSLGRAVQAAINWVVANHQRDGRFVYYYDPANDSHRDHEHSARDPMTNPYYNILRHCGGVVTLLHYLSVFYGDQRTDRLLRREDFGTPGDPPVRDAEYRERLVHVIRAGVEFYVRNLVKYETSLGVEGAYAFYNRKAKLGGSGIGLYMLALYQKLLGDDRYAGWAKLVASHLESQILASGEFMYYYVYLDRVVREADNKSLFSFYYPGEAVIGLANYCEHICTSAKECQRIYGRLESALQFLLVERPRRYREHYQSLPADSWLMMGINDLWDQPTFRQPLYSDFVFGDADQMVAHMYTEQDALYPDYVGSFYYQYGDHPYPDGARAEGLLAAYVLAVKTGDDLRCERYRAALVRLAWSTLHLCNDASTMYCVPNPVKSIGGIRFKFTRQWFRIDTIQHVASFYLKLLPSLCHSQR